MKNTFFLNSITKKLETCPTINLKDLNGHTIIFIIDMVNGFTKEGNLASQNVKSIIKPIAQLIKQVISEEKNKATTENYIKTKIIAFNDAHNEHSPEFDTYPNHCIENSKESNLIAELQFPEIKIINKNSTNGFFAFDFKPNLQWDNIIIVGCCTDICIYQFALSCKTWFNQHNKTVNVIVPMDMTHTFDNYEHPAKLINELFWYSMITNGIKVIKTIK